MNFSHFAYKRRTNAILGSSASINGFQAEAKKISRTENTDRSFILIDDEEPDTLESNFHPSSSSSKDCINISSDSDLEAEMNKPLSSAGKQFERDLKDVSVKSENGKITMDTDDKSSQGLDCDNNELDKNEHLDVESLEHENEIKQLKKMFPKAKEERIKKLINRFKDLSTVKNALSWLYPPNEGKEESQDSDSSNSLNSSMPGKRVALASDDDSAELYQPRKKIKSTEDSTPKDDTQDSIASVKFYGNSLTDKTERKALKKLRLIFPDRDEKELLEVFQSTGSVRAVISKLCGSPKKRGPRRRKDSDEDDSEDDKTTPYQRVQILSFLEESSIAELSFIPGCSVKKAERLAQLRPFGSWRNMVHKLDSAKGLSSQIATDCLSLLEERDQLSELMARCERISKTTLKLLSLRMETSSADAQRSKNNDDAVNGSGEDDVYSKDKDDDEDGDKDDVEKDDNNDGAKDDNNDGDKDGDKNDNKDGNKDGDKGNDKDDNDGGKNDNKNDNKDGDKDDDEDDEEEEEEVLMLSPTKVKSAAPNVSVVSQPQLLNESLQLKPYQMTGLNWLVLMHEQKMNGILADEMGLGKTVQTISLLAYLAEQGEEGPHVVVVPASTFDNWVREFQQWLPSFKCIQYYGSLEERADLREQLLYNEIEFDVVITTYSMAISTPLDRQLFRKLKCHYAVFDEAHMLKNMQSQRYGYLMNFKAQRRLLLTGTPLQNNILELMSLLSFVMPSMFGECFGGIKLLFSNKSGSTADNKYEKERVAQAKRIMKPFVLRRLKKDVLVQLPAKHEHVVRCELTRKQRQMYDELFIDCSKEYRKGVGKKCENLLMMLRKMANHPLLCRQEYNDEKLWQMARLYCKDIKHRDSEPELVHEDMTVMSDFELHRLCLEEEKLASFALDTKLFLDCGKFTYLDRILPDMKLKGDRVLLFSQFTMVMDVIGVYLEMRGHRFIRMDGQTPVVERQSLIDQFNSNSEIFIFLLSTRAGGLGINLTSANTVIIHDIDFNPYNDKQAEDRCHRVGQTREVNVHKLISENTVEEAMLTCAERKLRLEQDIAGKDQNSMENPAKDAFMLLTEIFKEKNC